MCGIAGHLEVRRVACGESPHAVVSRMNEIQAHRGPNDEGVWKSPDGAIAFGHTRLSILDTSSRGRQPMSSRCGRYVVAYNGEIYNFKALRRELGELGSSFSSESDTEVMLEAIARWGVRDAVQRFVGMFAFALFDIEQQLLFLVRDRFGIKPIAYRLEGGSLTFASEVAAIAARTCAPAGVCDVRGL